MEQSKIIDTLETYQPAAEVIRGGMKRPHAIPVLGGAPAVAKPKLPALGFAAAAEGRGCRKG